MVGLIGLLADHTEYNFRCVLTAVALRIPCHRSALQMMFGCYAGELKATYASAVLPIKRITHLSGS